MTPQTDPADGPPPASPTASTGPAGTPAGLFAEVSSSLDALVHGFGRAEWHAAALVGWTVRDVVAHLAAVHEVALERLVGRTAAAVDLADLHRANERVIDELRQADVPATRARWQAGVTGLHEAVAAPAVPTVGWLGLEPPASALLVDRAFETWIHADDIRRAVGLPGVDPSGPHLRVLCDLAVQVLPMGLVRTGRPHDALVTLELTGPGGGAWTMPLGAGAASGRVLRITAPARELCLLMADRLEPAELDWSVEGDGGASAVARDLALAAPSFARA